MIFSQLPDLPTTPIFDLPERWPQAPIAFYHNSCTGIPENELER
jgi:hypothetical protein